MLRNQADIRETTNDPPWTVKNVGLFVCPELLSMYQKERWGG